MEVAFIVVSVMAIAILIFKSVLKEISSKKCHNCDQDGNLQ